MEPNHDIVSQTQRQKAILKLLKRQQSLLEQHGDVLWERQPPSTSASPEADARKKQTLDPSVLDPDQLVD